jgi:riboflavin kinase/FMN adenylyltransferase
LRFDEGFSHMPAGSFITDILHRGLGAAHLACGPDFAFGHRRGGDVKLLAARAEALGMGLTLVPPYADARGPLSSTRIRRALQDGYPDWAAAELGRPWSIRGIVAHGDKRGRTIGFPTANIPLGAHLEPARGVYAVSLRLEDGSTRQGVANIGRRPTVSEGTQSRLEAHIFDFDGDIYGQEISVALLGFLRAEQKFAGLDALRAQIALDADAARALHASRTTPSWTKP